MILFRAIENELGKYVRGVEVKPAHRWSDNVEKLKRSEVANKSVVKEFDWLRDKRNDAEYPDKRYTQEEAEVILHHISGLVKAIYLSGKVS